MSDINFEQVMHSRKTKAPTPAAQVQLLKKEIGPLRYAQEIIPGLLNTQAGEGQEISKEQSYESKVKILRMLQTVFTVLAEENRGNAECWPTGLQALDAFSDDPEKLEQLMVYRTDLTPDMRFDSFSVDVDMARVPLFMEWQASDTVTIRIMVDLRKSVFTVMHLLYEQQENGLLYVAGAVPAFINIFGFSMDDLHLVSRLRTIDAAFTLATFDAEGDVDIAYRQLHTPFSKYTLCH